MKLKNGSVRWVTCFVAMFVCMAFLASCYSDQDEIYDRLMASSHSDEGTAVSVDYDSPAYLGPKRPEADASPTPVPDDGLSGKLIIKSYQQRGATPAIDLLAKEFCQLHPRVEIETEYDETWEESLNREEREARRNAFHTRVRVEIASGEADYLLYGASEFLDYYGLAQSGALADLWEFWRNDPDIREEEYFLPVIEAFQAGDVLPVIPYGFFLEGVYLNKALLQEQLGDIEGLSSVNAEDILGWYEGARAARPGLQLFFTAQGKDCLFPTELPRYIQLEQKVSLLDSPACIRFLERTGKTRNDDPELNPENEVARGEKTDFEGALRFQNTGKVDDSFEYYASNGIPCYKNIVTKSRPAFALKAELSLQDFLEAQQHKMEFTAGPYPLTSTDGQLGVTVLSETFAMPSSMQDKGLAWEFIKYCLSEREDLTFDHFGYTGQGYYMREAMPVNRANFMKMAEEMPEYIRNNFSAPGYERLQYDLVDRKGMEAYMDDILKKAPVNLGKYSVDLQDYLDEYYLHGLSTPEQAAEKMHGRVYIWLNE